MQILSLFPTPIYQDSLGSRAQRLNSQLLREIEVLSTDDEAGLSWSEKNYPNGYTSYASANQMHLASPSFAELETLLAPHLKKYLRKLLIIFFFCRNSFLIHFFHFLIADSLQARY